MAKRRTKKQKVRLSKKRQVAKSSSLPRKKDRSLEYGYGRDLIKKDLVKTIVLSFLILLIELGLFFLLTK